MSGAPKVPATHPSALDRRLLATLERAFAHHAAGDARIDRAAMQRALGLRSEYLAGRVLSAFDGDGDGVISREEFVEGVRRLVLGTTREKLAFAFHVHDHDGDGFLSYEELLRMIAISLAESDTRRATQPPEQLARALFATADRDGDGRIGFDELEAVVRRRPELLQEMTRSEASWIVPNEELLDAIGAAHPRRQGSFARRMEGVWLPATYVALWVTANVAAFVLGMVRTPNANAWMQAGHALGVCITLNGALILVPVMRRLLTRVRASVAGRAVPVDHAVTFHKVTGQALVALAFAHAGAFAVAFARGHAHGSLSTLIGTGRGLTGLGLLVILGVMWVFALGPVRRSRRFELFYFTHLLYVAWFALAAVHAPAFLLVAGVPLLGFVAEQVLRRRRRALSTSVLAIEALRSGVTRLELERPPGFLFGAGDYVFLRLPWIARHEWHPFTISSAPERRTLTFHARSLGNWTAALRRAVEAREATGIDAPLVAHVDGPYGSPSAPIFQSRFAVLVGAGIGVTPFASVLESIVLRGNGEGARSSRLEKAHFFWLNRDQLSFEWFAALLSDLERIDMRELLDVHLCMTGGRSGATSLGLEVAREILRAAGRSDIVTGLRIKTHMGPPDWRGWLAAIAGEHQPAPVDVFFCGPPGLARKLRPICRELGMSFHEERF